MLVQSYLLLIPIDEIFNRRVVALLKVLWVVVLRWTVIAGWSLKLEWMAAHVCGCARALLVGGGVVLVEARERHDKVLSGCMHSLLG